MALTETDIREIEKILRSAHRSNDFALFVLRKAIAKGATQATASELQRIFFALAKADLGEEFKETKQAYQAQIHAAAELSKAGDSRWTDFLRSHLVNRVDLMPDNMVVLIAEETLQLGIEEFRSNLERN